MAEPATLVITGARLIDGDGGPPLENATVTMAGGRFTAVATGGEPPADRDQHVDGRGLTLLPGLIDAHAHVGLVGLAPGAEPPAAVLAARMFANCATALDEGFTTLRDLGGADGGLVAAIEAGLVRAPRVLPSGPVICQTGGHADFAPPFGEMPSWPPGLISPSLAVDDAGGARAAARVALKRGATQLKVILNGGFVSGTKLEHTFLTADEVRAVAEEARARDTYVAAHVHTNRALAIALDAGVRSIEHGTFLRDAEMKAIAKAGAFLVPTLLILAIAIDHAADFGLTPASAARLEEALDASREAVRVARCAGVRMGLGSDLVGPGQRGRGQELVLRARIEDPMAAIVAATAENAALLGRADTLGRIAPGMTADLVALAGDPLSDPDLLGDGDNVVLVVRDGRVVKDARARDRDRELLQAAP
jgi:imidazolonepropionase-like amidohydrolase